MSRDATVPSGVSQCAGGFLQGSVASEGGGSPVAIEAGGSVFYLSTQSTACMRDVISGCDSWTIWYCTELSH